MAFTIGTGNRGALLRQQTSFGTVGSGSVFYGLIDDESFTTTFDISTRADMTRYGATTTKTGKRYSEGTINMALDDSGFCALLLKGIFPSVSTSGSGDPYSHACTEIAHDDGRAGATSFPVYHILIQRDEKEHSYSSLSLNRLAIKGSVGEYVMLSADFVGKAEGEDGQTSPANLSNEGGSTVPDAGEPVHFQSAEVKFKASGASTQVSSVDIEFNLNRDVDAAFALGSDTCVREAPPQLREITGSVEFIAPIHSTSVDEPIYGNIIDGGSSTVYQPGSSNPAITLVFTSSTNHDITIKLYNVQWEAPTSNVSGRDTQSMTLGFTALFDETKKAMATCDIRNANSSL
ncbi:MAG: hypothetical protein CMC15_14870 [Flavobacteriaceae bacterium]|nr:hypothetical protein [Flavobacteriaceae bacterium]